MRPISGISCCFVFFLLGDPAMAEDVSVELGPDDGFVVRDEADVDRLRVDSKIRIEAPTHIELLVPGFGGSASHHQVALALTAGVAGGLETIPLLFEREENNKVCWFNVGAGFLCSAFIRVDGNVDGTYDPETGELNIIDTARIIDPDGTGEIIQSMAQFGADVENTLLLKGGGAAPVNGRPKEKLILGLDKFDNWVWKVEDDGKTCWGSPTEMGASSWDLCLERVDDAGFEYARFTMDVDGTPVAVDLKAPLVQGTGVATHGPLIWGDGSDDFDTGDEACQSQGLTCQTSFTTAGLEQSCSLDHGAAGTYFYAMCK